MDQREKDRIAAELAAEYRQTVRETAVTEARNERKWNKEVGVKSIGIAYLFWFFLGGFGAHRFYLGYTASGTGMLLATVFSVVSALLPLLFLFSFPLMVMVAAWWLIDAFLIPRMMPEDPASVF